MEKYDEKVMKVAEKYAESLIDLKVMQGISTGTTIAGGVAAALGVVALIALPSMAVITGVASFFLSLMCFSASLICVNVIGKKYKEIAKQLGMSKKEVKQIIKSEEMKKCLQHIFSDEYESDVEMIESLSQTFNGTNPKYDSPNFIIESIRKDIYGKNPNKR